MSTGQNYVFRAAALFLTSLEHTLQTQGRISYRVHCLGVAHTRTFLPANAGHDADLLILRELCKCSSGLAVCLIPSDQSTLRDRLFRRNSCDCYLIAFSMSPLNVPEACASAAVAIKGRMKLRILNKASKHSSKK